RAARCEPSLLVRPRRYPANKRHSETVQTAHLHARRTSRRGRSLGRAWGSGHRRIPSVFKNTNYVITSVIRITAIVGGIEALSAKGHPELFVSVLTAREPWFSLRQLIYQILEHYSMTMSELSSDLVLVDYIADEKGWDVQALTSGLLRL